LKGKIALFQKFQTALFQKFQNLSIKKSLDLFSKGLIIEELLNYSLCSLFCGIPGRKRVEETSERKLVRVLADF
jgi:hypothetical protein